MVNLPIRFQQSNCSKKLSCLVSTKLFILFIQTLQIFQVLYTSPSYVGESELAEMSETDFSNLNKFGRGSTILRGHFIHKFIQVIYDCNLQL
jgi:hypothetical protein